MEHRIGCASPKSKAPGIRRALLMLVAFTYLFVGFAHSVAHAAGCFDEAFVSTVVSEAAVPSGADSDDGESTKSPAVAGHCHAFAPIMIPAAAPDAGPSVRPKQIAFRAPLALFADHPRLDTPPPKHLT